MKNWIRFLGPRNFRKARRQSGPPLITYYWDGERAAPSPRSIHDISPKGFYLLTERRWYVGTLIRMTMQLTDGAEFAPKEFITVLTKVVRSGPDGVGFEFICAKTRAAQSMWGADADRMADKKTLKKFVRRLQSAPEHHKSHFLAITLL